MESVPGGNVREELRTLQAVCRSLGSPSDPVEATLSAAGWVRQTLGASAGIRIMLRDPLGGLRQMVADGDDADLGRRRSARRRAALEAGEPMRAPLREGRELAIIPLVSKGEAFGVLEVVAPADVLDRRWDTVDAVASSFAGGLRILKERADLRRQVDALRRSADLAGELIMATSAKAAVQAALRFCHDRFEVPVAAWIEKPGTGRLDLLGVRGLGSRRRSALRSAVGGVRRWDRVAPEQRNAYVVLFAEVTGAEEVAVVDAGSSVIFVGGTSPAMSATLEAVQSLLVEALDHQAAMRDAQQHDERLDLGIALAAHEVRAPLQGARAVIDLTLGATQGSGGWRDLLERSSRELDQLSDLVEGLLKWSAGREPLRLKRVDLSRVVRTAIDTSAGFAVGDKIALMAEDPVPVRADPRHLRVAVANLVRNALAHSPPDAPVMVTVRASDEQAVVTVEDRGAGVRAEEQTSIFDPFVRGRQLSSNGYGLGLFIVRRIAEAHNGRVWVDPSGMGATFHLVLPLDDAEGAPVRAIRAG